MVSLGGTIMSRIAGRASLNRRLGAIPARTRRAVYTVLRQGGQLVADDAARRIMEGSKTGAVRPSRWRKGALHQASAPGESPAGDSGRLAQSMTWVGHEATLTVDVGTATPYAVPLELGTEDGRIAPRPFLDPAFRGLRGRISAAIAVAVRRSLRGAGR